MRRLPVPLLLLVAAAMVAGDNGTDKTTTGTNADPNSYGPEDPRTPSPGASLTFESYAKLVAELELRRRVNVLYPNPQTLFDGLQVGFVNTTTGNLTFLRRDLVVRARGPVAFARVYDSRIKANADFGPGWRLSLAEELLVRGRGLIYVDGAGGQHRFRGEGGEYTPHPPTPRHRGTEIIMSGDHAVLTEADGTVRTFKAAGADTRFRIARLRAKAQTLDFAYAGDRLAAILSDGRTLFRIRRQSGRIVEVLDDQQRRVQYHYSRSGRLSEVADVAGNVWPLRYEDGLLAEAVGPNGRTYLRVSYDDSARVVESLTGREYMFAYAPNHTTVTEGTGERRVFQRNSAGVAVALTSSAGPNWRLELDAANRVRQLVLPSASLRYSYGARGRVERVIEVAAANPTKAVPREPLGLPTQAPPAMLFRHDSAGRVTARSFVYDAAGRLAAVGSTSAGESLGVSYASGSVILSGAADLEYTLAPNGHLESVRAGDDLILAERDRQGDVTTLRGGDQTVHFSRDGAGRIVSTTHPSGASNRYFHDALGNRNLIEYGNGGMARYRHDPAGNIVEVEVTDRDGSIRRQFLTVGAMNRVERISHDDGRVIDIAFDAMGRPAAFRSGSDRVVVGYESGGLLAELTSTATGVV